MANLNAGGKEMGVPGFGGMPSVKLTARKSTPPGYPKGNFPGASFGQKRATMPTAPKAPFGTARKPTMPTGKPDFC